MKVPEPLPRSASVPMAKRDPSNKTRMVIVGGGPGGLNCAESLRQSNFTGEIMLISSETRLPYDRTMLSKILPTGDSSKFGLRSQKFFEEEASITWVGGKTVTKVNSKDKTVTLSDGS